MNGWRLAYGVGLFVFVVLPLLMPLGELLSPAAWAWTPDDVERQSHLCTNTLTLTAGVVAISLPIGICLAVLLFRTSFFGRRSAQVLLALALFVPLPIVVSSWQALLGAQGWLPIDLWRDAPGRPWASGMQAAIWIHAIAAVPWAAFLVGMGLSRVEPELEDEARQVVGPWRVLLVITLPRTRASLLAAALFVAMQTAAETTVTEMMQVRTLAEEMRTQFALSEIGLARTLVVTLPALLAAWALVLAVVAHIEKSLPPMLLPQRMDLALDLRPRWLLPIISAALIGMLIMPLGSLVRKLGLAGHPEHWETDTAWYFLRVALRVLGSDLLASLVTSAVTGLGVAVIGVIGCWLAKERVWFRWLLFGVLTWVWVLPGPAVGMALHQTIMLLPEGPWKVLLWYGPSPAPLMWAQGLRTLPIAVIFLWPVVRLLPRELFEEARLGGAGALSEFLHVVAPATWRPVLVCGLTSSALCLAEVGASDRVATPGWEAFAATLLKQMHTGVDNSVSALCILMLLALTACLAVVSSLKSFLWR